ncbi:TolC family protein [Algoriphagus halophytocola]|uniref:TolC family protein n=1 Tax=Algoriphagus halophytocola TaxID=2991499 RepID=A0ABY6ML36_9BACT|nr:MULTISPECIES: TolC family protein [unclassified Algoriphagus]UZD23830.1 TolC family protein [Algoriphagus sp. TR-M5]WBL41197.1 TolC family protein [Algoriphagus sp. TR-M9]
MKKTLLSLAFLAGLGFSSFAQETVTPTGPLDLETAVSIALENNLTLKRSELNQLSNEATLLQNQGARYPSLTAGGSTNFNWGRSINPATNLFETQRIGNINLNASSNATIFNAGRINNTIKQTKTLLEQGLYNIESTKNTITLNVINNYINVVFNQEQVKIAENQLKTTQEQLDRTIKLVEAGSLPYSDQLDLQSQLATNNVDLINAKATLNNSMLTLAQSLQIPYTPDFQIQRPELSVDDTFMISESSSTIYSTALETMPEIKAAALGVQSAEYDIKLAKAGYYPTLGIGANLGTNYVDIYEEKFADQLDFNFSQSVGIQLSIPIFSRLSNKANVQRANVQKRLAEVAELEAKNQLRQDIETAFTNALASEQSYQASLSRIESLEESFRIAKQRFELGAINSVDFQVAQNNLFSAQSQLVYDKYTYIFRVKVLDFYLGNPINLN